MYDSEWDLTKEFLQDLVNLQQAVLKSGNKPNQLLDQVDWWVLQDLEKLLEQIKDLDNQQELNQIEFKLKQLS